MIRPLYSQAGQDLWVMRDVFGFMRGGTFVDIGAAGGVELSNTYALERRLGWSGLCVEANPVTFGDLQKNRQCQCLNVCLDEVRKEVKFDGSRGFFGGIVDADTDNTEAGADSSTLVTRTFAEVIADEKLPETIHYLSVDVEGAEERVMATFPFRTHRFLSATIERPGQALRETLASEGYVLVAELPNLDAFYLHPSMVVSYNVRARIAGTVRAMPPLRRLAYAVRWISKHGLRATWDRL